MVLNVPLYSPKLDVTWVIHGLIIMHHFIRLSRSRPGWYMVSHVPFHSLPPQQVRSGSHTGREVGDTWSRMYPSFLLPPPPPNSKFVQSAKLDVTWYMVSYVPLHSSAPHSKFAQSPKLDVTWYMVSYVPFNSLPPHSKFAQAPKLDVTWYMVSYVPFNSLPPHSKFAQAPKLDVTWYMVSYVPFNSLPPHSKFAQAPKLDVTWVAHKLLPELGLPQYSHVFERNLVDGRILNSLCRRDLEKHFDIHRKFHQASILHAVELLRRMEFDREVGDRGVGG